MPTTSWARRKPVLLAAAAASVTALVATSLSTPAEASSPAARAGGNHAKAAAAKHDRSWRAQRVLARAQKAFSPDTLPNERPDATMALRNLWLLQDALSPADQAVARRLARRPVKPATIGDDHILLHYDPAELNPVAFDQNTALATVKNVADTYAASGYRRPKSDKGEGGDNRTDIYIDSLQPGLYGYCTIDKAPKPPHFDVPAFCVLDNDYAGFPRTPIENLQVTAAHEYYHATQFAYDVADDSWFLEATATWAEDEVYDSVNDNVQYLRRSPITAPRRPMDKFGGGFHYGVWSFFRFLTERYPAKSGAMPRLLLQMWKYADSSKGPGNDLYSTQAINKALKKNKSSMAEQFARYSSATRATRVFFKEGKKEHYPVKPLAGRVSLPSGQTKTFEAELDHLTSATVQFVRHGGNSRLTLHFVMAATSAGSRATVLVRRTNGSLDLRVVKLGKQGKASMKILFNRSVDSVDVTLVNASTKFRECYRHGFPQHVDEPISCSGRAVDDDKRAKVQGTVS